MVDEYQDTNAPVRHLWIPGGQEPQHHGGGRRRPVHLFVARRRLAQHPGIREDYPEAKVVKLEQNYRSVGNVLAAANAVIANNQHRKEKRLFTDAGDGDKISVYLGHRRARDEGRWIAGRSKNAAGPRVGAQQHSGVLSHERPVAHARRYAVARRRALPHRRGHALTRRRDPRRDGLPHAGGEPGRRHRGCWRHQRAARRGISKTTVERIDQYVRARPAVHSGGAFGGRRTSAPPPAMLWGSSSRSSRTAPPTGAICARSWR